MGEKLQFTELDQYLFGQGTHYDVYRKLGAHPVKQGKKEGVYFAVWAPNAQAVSVIGEFNDMRHRLEHFRCMESARISWNLLHILQTAVR